MSMKAKIPYPAEATEQKNLIAWWDRYALSSHGLYEPEMLFHIPNEGKRGIIGGALMKQQGLRSGVPDLMLAYPVGNYSALFIEMKSMKGKASPQQKEFIEKLNKRGYRAEICKGFTEAMNCILNYLEIGLSAMDSYAGD